MRPTHLSTAAPCFADLKLLNVTKVKANRHHAKTRSYSASTHTEMLSSHTNKLIDAHAKLSAVAPHQQTQSHTQDVETRTSTEHKDWMINNSVPGHDNEYELSITTE